MKRLVNTDILVTSLSGMVSLFQNTNCSNYGVSLVGSENFPPFFFE